MCTVCTRFYFSLCVPQFLFIFCLLLVVYQLLQSNTSHSQFKPLSNFILSLYTVTLCTWHGYQILIRTTQLKKEEVKRESEGVSERKRSECGGKGLALMAVIERTQQKPKRKESKRKSEMFQSLFPSPIWDNTFHTLFMFQFIFNGHVLFRIVTLRVCVCVYVAPMYSLTVSLR